MSVFQNLSLSSMEAIAALLLLDSNDIDSVVTDEMQNLGQKLKTSECHQDDADKSCAFRIKEEDKQSFSNIKSNQKTPYNRDNTSTVQKKKYGYWLTAARTPIFAESYLPKMSSNDYKIHFGLSSSQIEKLMKMIAPLYVQNERQKNLESFVLVGLSALATQKSCREIGMQMSRSKGHVSIWSQKFNAILADNFTNLIKWPKENFDYIESKFQEICDFPGVVGAFGACHIPLKHPAKDSDSCFKNYKGFYSLVLSSTCDYNMCFTSLSVDTPANFQSTNGMSSKTILNLMTNPNSLIQKNTHILAGPGFPLCNQILTPYLPPREGSLTDQQLLFNRKLQETRKVILQTLSLTRGRFRRLQVIDVTDFHRAAACIVAACILHNFATEDEGFQACPEDSSLEIEDVLQMDSSEDPPCPKRDRIASALLLGAPP